MAFVDALLTREVGVGVASHFLYQYRQSRLTVWWQGCRDLVHDLNIGGLYQVRTKRRFSYLQHAVTCEGLFFGCRRQRLTSEAAMGNGPLLEIRSSLLTQESCRSRARHSNLSLVDPVLDMQYPAYPGSLKLADRQP